MSRCLGKYTTIQQMYLFIVISIGINEKRNFYEAKLFCENKHDRLMNLNESVSHIPGDGDYWVGTFRQDVATDIPKGNHNSLQYNQ
jgi:hypothetical protein